ncbi:MAG: hypothetical protein HQ518_10820 [Rhodopirellula sp.]|nr:hypothetical protein [Rhodopirellula sp.]
MNEPTGKPVSELVANRLVRCSTLILMVLLSGMAFDAAFFGVRTVCADEYTQVEIKLTDRVPYGREPVDYFGKESGDAVAELGRQLASGKARLNADAQSGYLLSVLELLGVPLESQILVYSKTARAPELVSPKTPRAIFFNDEVSVAWIPESRELELTAVDPVKGVNFYTLSQPLDASDPSRAESKANFKGSNSAGNNAAPKFLRRDRCLACHAGRSSLEVPGLLLRAFQTDRTGKPIVGFSRVTHDMPYRQRWGGWYVTGTPASVVHRGNLIGEADNIRQKSEPSFAVTLQDFSQHFDVDGYPYSSSDFVAHLVFAHQAHGTNLLIRAGMEARLNRRSDVESQLVRYLVFADAPPLDLSPADAASVRKQSEFAASFVKRGPRDEDGNSLRDLSLVDGVFKYRLSFLIGSRLFDKLPEECRSRLLSRLWTGLNSENSEKTSEAFSHLGQEERTQIVSLVRATVPRLPACWHATSE